MKKILLSTVILGIGMLGFSQKRAILPKEKVNESKTIILQKPATGADRQALKEAQGIIISMEQAGVILLQYALKMTDAAGLRLLPGVRMEKLSSLILQVRLSIPTEDC